MFFQEILIGTANFLLDTFKTILKYALVFEQLLIHKPKCTVFQGEMLDDTGA